MPVTKEAQAVANESDVEEEEEEEETNGNTRRKLAAGQQYFFESLDKAKANSITYEDGEVNKTFRVYTISDKDGKPAGYSFARNDTEALGVYARHKNCEAEVSEPGQRGGRKRKIDDTILQYAKLLKEVGKTKDLASFLADNPQYESHL